MGDVNVSDSINRRSGRRLVLAGIAVAALAAPAAGHAAGLTAECLISKASPAALDRLVVAYTQRGRAGAIAAPLQIDPDAILACAGPTVPLTPAVARELGQRAGELTGVGQIEYASRAYLADHGVSGAALDAAWRQLGATKRELLRGAFRAMQANQSYDGDAVGSAVVDGAQLAGWKSADGAEIVLKYGDYFLARAVREDMESR
jgi:hypothetical protein